MYVILLNKGFKTLYRYGPMVFFKLYILDQLALCYNEYGHYMHDVIKKIWKDTYLHSIMITF
jgi:hypothetical protein